MLDELILFTAGDDACGSFSADSSRHRFNRYRLVDHLGDERRVNRRRRTDMTEAEGKATRGKATGSPSGKRWVRDTCRHHEMALPNGRVSASVVTDGDASDAAVFAEICSGMPAGSGNALGTAPTARKRTALWPSAPNATRTLSLGRSMPGQRNECLGEDGAVVEGSPMPVQRDLSDQIQHRGPLPRHQGQVRVLRPVRDAGDAKTQSRHRVHLPQHQRLTGGWQPPSHMGLSRGHRGACAPAAGPGRIVAAPPQVLPGRYGINPFRAGWVAGGCPRRGPAGTDGSLRNAFSVPSRPFAGTVDSHPPDLAL